MSNLEYIIKHLPRSWYRTWLSNFRGWKALVFGPNLDDDYYYYLWFFQVINTDLTPSKRLIQRLKELVAEFPVS